MGGGGGGGNLIILKDLGVFVDLKLSFGVSI